MALSPKQKTNLKKLGIDDLLRAERELNSDTQEMSVEEIEKMFFDQSNKISRKIKQSEESIEKRTSPTINSVFNDLRNSIPTASAIRITPIPANAPENISRGKKRKVVNLWKK